MMATIVRFHQLGGPEVLKFEDGRCSSPARARCGCEYRRRDSIARRRFYCRGQYLEQPKLPSRIGYEVAGVVEARR